jgi:long-chain fatty acid transport protein
MSESGGADMGMAGAGRAALSLDPAAQAGNPAALGGLPRSAITAAVMPLDIELDFRVPTQTPPVASDRTGVTPVPALYGAWRDDRITYGLGVYSNVGLAFDLGTQWAGSRSVERVGLNTLNIAPAVAYAVNDRLTVGASVAAQLARYEAAVAVANDALYYGPPVGLPDGQLKIDGDSWAPGGQLGLTYRVDDRVQAGLAWTAPVHHSFVSDVHARDVHPVLAALLPGDGDVTLDATLPQQVLVGVTHRPTPDTVLALGLTWQDWSSLDDATVKMPGRTSELFPAGLNDTWGLSLGVRHATRSRWNLAAGVAYDSDPGVRGQVPAYFPVAEQWRIAAGAERSYGDDLTLRVCASIMAQGDARFVQTTHPLPLPGIPPLQGTIEDSRVYVLGFGVDFAM